MTQKLTLQTKLKHLQNRVQKTCSYHNRQASLFCLKATCNKSPFLCNNCLRENNHGHNNESIFQFYEFIRNFCIQLNQQTKSMKNIFDEQERDSQWVVKQQLRFLQHLQILQKQINDIFQQAKGKVHIQLDRNLARKTSQSQKSNSNLKMKVYSNPNLLINKIISDKTNNFILEMKGYLIDKENQRLMNQKTNNTQIRQYRNQIIQIKSKIKQLLNASNGISLHAKNQQKRIFSMNSINDIRAVFSKSIPLIDLPFDIFSTTENILVPLAKQTYSYNILEKYRSQMLSFTLRYAVKSNLINDTSFIGLSGPNSLIISGNQNKSLKINLDIKITSLGYLASYSKAFALLGNQAGSFDVFDIQTSQIKFRHKLSQSPVMGIQVFSRNALIICFCQNSSIHLFKYKNEYQAFFFQYSHQLNLSSSFKDISMIKIFQQQLILFGSNRNILVYDLMLYCQKVRTNFIEKCPPFTHGKCLQNGKQFQNELNFFTLSRGQNTINWWVFDRNKMSLSMNPLVIQQSPKQIRQIRGFEMIGDTLWIIQSDQKQLYGYNIKKDKE